VAAALMEWRIYALPGGIFPQGLSFCVFCGVAKNIIMFALIYPARKRQVKGFQTRQKPPR